MSERCKKCGNTREDLIHHRKEVLCREKFAGLDHEISDSCHEFEPAEAPAPSQTEADVDTCPSCGFVMTAKGCWLRCPSCDFKLKELPQAAQTVASPTAEKDWQIVFETADDWEDHPIYWAFSIYRGEVREGVGSADDLTTAMEMAKEFYSDIASGKSSRGTKILKSKEQL